LGRCQQRTNGQVTASIVYAATDSEEASRREMEQCRDLEPALSDGDDVNTKA
jgi:hypothetical protein